LIGRPGTQMGGSVYARTEGLTNQPVPQFDPASALAVYKAYYECVKAGQILSAHDISEGGLAVTLAEMAFSGKAGIDITLDGTIPAAAALFNESPGQIVIEVPPDHLESVRARFAGQPFAVIGKANAAHTNLTVHQKGTPLLNEDLTSLKALWKGGLAKWY
jgi:phosphoribosylformylglycinamidine synthase